MIQRDLLSQQLKEDSCLTQFIPTIKLLEQKKIYLTFSISEKPRGFVYLSIQVCSKEGFEKKIILTSPAQSEEIVSLFALFMCKSKSNGH